MTAELSAEDRARIRRRVMKFRQEAGAGAVPVDTFRLADRLRRDGILQHEPRQRTVDRIFLFQLVHQIVYDLHGALKCIY